MTKTNINSDKRDTFYNAINGDIVYKKQIYERNIWTGAFNTEELLIESSEAQAMIRESNKTKKISNTWLIAGASLYFGVSQLGKLGDPAFEGIGLWLLLGAGLFPSIYYNVKSKDQAEEAVDIYNQAQKPKPALGLKFMID